MASVWDGSMKCRTSDGSGGKTNWERLALEARKGECQGRRLEGEQWRSLKQGTLQEEHFEGSAGAEHAKRKGNSNLNTDLNSEDLGQRKDQKVRIFYSKFTLRTKNYHTIHHGTSHDLLGLIVHVLSINLLSTEKNQLFDRVSNKTSKGQYLLCFLSSS